MPWSVIRRWSRFFGVPGALAIVLAVPPLIRLVNHWFELGDALQEVPISIPFLYASAVAYVLTLGAYKVLCPPMMSNVASQHDYILNKQNKIRQLSDLLQNEATASETISKHLQKLIRVDDGKDNGLSPELKQLVADAEELSVREDVQLVSQILNYMQSVSELTYQDANIRNPLSRYFVSTLIFAYIGISGWSLVLNLIMVLREFKIIGG
jgi:hypothetical protein